MKTIIDKEITEKNKNNTQNLKKMKKAKVYAEIKSFLIIVFGLFVNTLGWTAFLIPGKVVGGGVSGTSALIFYATGIPVGVSYLVLNLILIAIGLKVLGKSFGIKTILGVLIASLFLSIGQKIITEPIVKDGFMTVVLGGALGGAGIGIVFSQGGSTGGTDIIAMLINKYRNISPGKVILYFDIAIIGSSYFLFKKIEPLVYGFVSITIVSYVIDLVLNGLKQSIQLFIVSKNYDQIAEKITADIHRGVTVIDAEGWYSKESTKIIMTVVRKNEAPRVNNIVKEMDPQAFISQAAVMGAYGKGFQEIRG